MRPVFFLISFFLSLSSVAQLQYPSSVKGAIQLEPKYDTCYIYTGDKETTIYNTNPRFKLFKELYKDNVVNARSFQNSLATSKIEINFSSNFDNLPDAKEAFRFAADMWEMELKSSVPIVIDADIIEFDERNVIGQNASNRVTNVPNAPDPTIAYVSSLGNAIAGTDLLPGQPDLIQTYNSAYSFYYGLDGKPAGKTDFVTIAFHEIGHGLGITGSSNAGQGVGMDLGDNPMAWDFFVELQNGIPIIDLGFGSDEQQAALVSDDLYIDSYNSVDALEGNRPKIFAPSEYNAGSSFSHWDEDAFPPGDPNSLMSPFIGTGEAMHDPGDITRGILQDMGWSLSPKFDFDLGIATISAPVSGLNLDKEAVSVIVGNRGLREVSNINIEYRVDDGPWISETFSGTIAPMEEVEFTFSQPAGLSIPGKTYRIEARVNYLVDENRENNVTYGLVTNLLPITEFPYTESFEDENAGWVVEKDDIWQRGNPSGNIINNASDGQNAWVTNPEGNYPDQQSSYLVSPVFNFSGKQDPTIEFDLIYDIEFGWDGAALQFSLNNGADWQTLGEYQDGSLNWYNDGEKRSAASDNSEGDDGIDALIAAIGNGNGWTGSTNQQWITARHVVPEAGGKETVIFRFVFASDQAVNSEGIGIDNLKIFAPGIVNDDVGIVSILKPVSGALTDQEQVEVVIRNFGINEATGFNINFKIDDNPIVSEQYDQVIAPGAMDTIAFISTADLSANKFYTIKSFTIYDQDQNQINDSTEVTIESILKISTFPYQESFEAGTGGWTSRGDLSSWELAIPDGNIIDTASHGIKAWVTNGSGNYNNKELSFLRSPVFNLTGFRKATMVFDLWYDTEKNKDGLFLQYSKDNGSTWITLGLNDNGVINGYNSSGLTSYSDNTKGDAWSGSSLGYRTVLFPLSSGSSSLQFRFVFIANDSNSREGVAIDNVRIFDPSKASFTLTCPDNVTANNDPGENFAFVTLDNPTVEGTANDVTFSNTYNHSEDPSANFPIGVSEVIFIADVDGIVKSCPVSVEVVDIEPPSIECPDNITVAIAPDDTSATVNYNLPSVADNFGFFKQVTYTNEQVVIEKAGIACPTGPNSFIRIFELEEDFNITSEFNVTSVDVGVQVVNEGDVHAEGDKVPAKINLYLFDTKKFSKDNPADLIFANMDLIKSRDFLLDIGLEDTIVNVPVNAAIPSGSAVVVEFFTEAGGDQLYPGANPDQTGDSYIVAPGCGIREPLSVGDPELDFPDSQWIINLNGLDKSNVLPALIAGEGSGGSFPPGVTTEEYQIIDFSGLSASCSFNVEVVEATLSAPSGPSVSNVQNNSFTVTWDAVTDVNYYEVFISKDNFSSFLNEYNGKIVEGTSLNVTGLEENTAYYVRVRSVNGPNPTAYSVFSSTLITSTFIKAPVVNTPTLMTDEQFKISWTEVNNVPEYEVDLSTDNFTTFVKNYQDSVVQGNEFIFTGIPPNTQYQYRVRAVNAGAKSAYSNVETAITLPKDPKAFSVENIGLNEFTAEWQRVSGAEHYLLDVSTDNFETYVNGLEAVEVLQPPYPVTGLKSNTTYQFRVRAFSSIGGESLNSNIIRVTTLAEPPVAVEPVRKADYAVIAAWRPSFNVRTYELDVSKDNFESFVVQGLAVNDTSKTILNLQPNTTYQYRVRAVNRKGFVSGSSNVISFTTPEQQLPAPVAEMASEIETSSFVANWSEVPGALYYLLQVSTDNFETILEEFEVFDNSQIISGLEDGENYYYRVKAFSNEGTSAFSEIINVETQIIVGISASPDQLLTFYPNPASDKVKLVSEGKPMTGISLSDIRGIRQIILIEKLSHYKYQLDITSLTTGIYIVRVHYEDGSYTLVKVIKKLE